MWFDTVLFIAFLLVAIFQAIFIILPLGNENSTVRRLPWVTFTIMAINVVVYFICLPTTVQQDRELAKTVVELANYLEKNEVILADDKVREKLKELGLNEKQLELIDEELKSDPQKADQYKSWLRTGEATKMREEITKLISKVRDAQEAHLYNKYGLAGAGKWKPYQLITHAFMHGNSHILGLVFPFHLFFNLLFFFAVGFTLEDLWGRGGFLVFYLSSAAAAAIPDLVGSPVAMIGASGAVSATMGAFLVRLPTTKIKVGWLVDPLAFPVLFLRIMFHKKPWGIVKVKGYYFLLYYFTSQLLFWWFINHKLGMSDGTSYKCHIAGFIFGGVFAFFMKAGQIEERYINPKIEAKVSFEGSPAVTRALEMLDRGQAELAERKLKAEFARNPNDPNTMMALIQVYQRGLNYEQLNAMYGRLIRYYLQNHDKEAALYAYDSLLSSFPDDDLRVQIPLRDWLSICEYLREAGMNREAGVEYERLVNAYPNDSLSVHACVLGGEAALAAHDNSRALRLFEKAEALGPGDGDASRVMKGLDKCRMRLDNRPTWVKQPTQSQGLSKDRDQKDLRF